MLSWMERSGARRVDEEDDADDASAALDMLAVLQDLHRGPEDAAEIRRQTFAPGEIVIAAGDRGDACYFILEGRARVHRDDRQLSILGPGHCFGELAILEDAPRSATVEAAEPLVVLRVEARRFRRWYERHPPLESLLGTLQQMYQRPQGGLVTIHRGEHEGRPCVSSVRELADGRTMMSTQIIGQSLLILSVSGAGEGEVETVEHARSGAGVRRTLHLRGGAVVRVDAVGDAAGIGHLAARMISARPLSAAELARFRWTGSTAAARAPAGLVCPCVGLARDEAAAMIGEGLGFEAIGRRCGAGTICGACRPEIEAIGRAPAPASAPRGLLRRLLGRGPAKR